MINNKSYLAQFIAHPIASKTLLVIILVMGVVGMLFLRQEVFPPFAPNRVDISVAVRGASAKEVELLVVKKIEQQLADVKEIQRIIANAYQDHAYIQLELMAEVNPDKALSLIKSQVDGISTFPEYAEPPIYTMPETTGPLLLVSLYGDVPFNVLYNQALDLSKQLSLLPGITLAEIDDAPEMEVEVGLTPLALQKYRLSMTDIAQAIRNTSINLSAGNIETANGKLLLRSERLALNTQDFENIVIRSYANGRILTIGDIATVSIKPVASYSPTIFNGKHALSLSIRRDEHVSLTRASNQIRNYLTQYQQQLGEHLTVQVWMDDSREFSSRVGLLLENGITGFFIICIFMGLFVHFRVALWTAIGIPVSMLGALGIIYMSGADISLNAITLFGFLIAAGLIVDDAIVIGESIHQETTLYGHSVDNVIRGAQKVAMPTTFGALTSIVAFFPLTLTEGKMGSQMAGIGLVVICCLIASIIESKLILPNHLLHKKRRKLNLSRLERLRGKTNSYLVAFSEGPYRRLLDRCLAKPYSVIGIALALFLLSGVIMFSGAIRMVTLPNIADYEVEALFNVDANLTAEQKQAIAQRLTDSLLQTNREVKEKNKLDYEPIIMHRMHIDGADIIFDVEISHREDAPFDAHIIANTWRNKVPLMPELESANIASGPNGDEQVAIQLSGDELTALLLAKDEVKKYLSSIDGVVDIRDNALSKSHDILVHATAAGEAYGVTQNWLANTIRSAFYGVEAQRVQLDEQEWRVMVRYDQSNRNSIGDLSAMDVALPDGHFMPLNTIAKLEQTQTDTLIQRIDAQRAITVYANTIGYVDAEGVAEAVVEDFLPQLAQKYPGVSYSIEGEAKDAAKSISSLISASIIAIFVMFALMAIPMKSYRYPFAIILILPLGFIGTVVGHLIVPIEYSLISMFGLIALMGVMINNGLLLVDYFLQNMQMGLSKKEAIMECCVRRLRPIFLTAVTTFAGLMPLLWESDPEALWLVPIAVSLGIGILLSTGLTLLLLPSILLLIPLVETTPSINDLVPDNMTKTTGEQVC